jgi:hypothetical protein
MAAIGQGDKIMAEKMTTQEMRQIAKSREPHGWGGMSQALLYAADVIDAALVLIHEQKKEIDGYKDVNNG